VIYQLLYDLMHGSAAIENRVATRIYPENAPHMDPQSPLSQRGACIIIRLITGQPEYSLTAETDCAHTIVQIDCYDSDPRKANSLFELVRNRLSGYRGTVSVLDDDGEAQSIDVREMTFNRTGQTSEEPRDASDRWTRRRWAELEVFHSQSVPTLT
jgi:hypothetical protein